VQGLLQFLRTFLSAEVWVLLGAKVYSQQGLRTAELRPWDTLRPTFQPTCCRFNGTSGSCSHEQHCPNSHAKARLFL